MTTIRTERMMAALPYQYHFSAIMEAIQAAQADEYDSLEEKDLDLQKQLYILMATWGLKYWEYDLGIPTVESDGYDIRRSRVLSAWRGLASQFSAALVDSICEAYSNGETQTTIDIPGQTVKVKFIGARGIPPNINDLKAAVDNVVHAHLGVEYSFTYLTWNELDNEGFTWNQLDSKGLSWGDLEVMGVN